VSKLDPRQTLITLPDEIRWQVPEVAPPESMAEAVLAGADWQERRITTERCPAQPNPRSSRSPELARSDRPGWTQSSSRCGDYKRI
jgi:hypothetical protein